MNNQVRVLEDALARGHQDVVALRELLIATTSTNTQSVATNYFRERLDDGALLSSLVEIAIEGEDAGDAPWAAANVIEEFPPELLRTHRAELEEFADHPWIYLHKPARRALEKLSSGSRE